MDRSEQRRIVEALVLASPEPLSAQRLADLIPYVKPAKAKELIDRYFNLATVLGAVLLIGGFLLIKAMK